MSRGGIELRAARVSLVTGVSTVLSIAFQLVSVPICIKYWGQETYGTWLALLSAFLLIRSLETGYVTYAGNRLNYLYHQDTKALREHLSSAVAGVALIGGFQLVLVITALISDRLIILLGLGHDGDSGFEGRVGLLVLMTTWVLTGSYFGIVHRLLIPAGLMYEAAWWAMIFQVSQFAVGISAALLQLGMVQTSVLFALSQLVIYLGSAVYVRYKLPAYFPWWRGGRVSIGLKDLGKSMLLTVSYIVQQSTTNGVVLLASALAGPIAVPVFTTVRTMSNLWTNLTTVLTAPLLPDVVRFHAKGEPEKLIAVNQAHGVLVGSAVNGGVLLFYPLLHPLYEYWTGNAIPLDKTLLCLLLGSVVVTNAGALMAMYLSGINSVGVVLVTSALRSVFTIGVGALAYMRFGLAGLGLGILVGELIVLTLTAYFFAQCKVVRKGARRPGTLCVPAMLGMASALLFLVGEGFDWVTFKWSWPVALLAVGVASGCGWRQLNHDVKARVISLATKRLGKGAVDEN